MLQRKSNGSGLVWYESPLLAGVGVPHAFSTRLGGVSPAPFDSLNLGNPSGCDLQDSTDRIAENYARLQQAIGVADRRLLRVHQAHGCGVAIAADSAWDPHRKADAIVVTDRRQLASVRVADCVPVLLAAGPGAVAAVHAGWRGVIAGVVPRAVEAIRRIENGEPIVAAIGPCIGFDAFEVGAEVLEEFVSAFGEVAPIRSVGAKGFVDLRRAIQLQVLGLGIPAQRIDSTDRCTVRDKEEFFSHRRERGVTGRMAAMIGVAPL